MKNPMRIAFLGTPEPAAQVLEALVAAGQEIACVVTQPDRPAGRGQKVDFSPVKRVALKHSFPLEQPERVRGNQEFALRLNSMAVDLGVVVAYGKILPKEVLGIPKYGFINLHASLLPKYRGAAPIQWALLAGEKESGLTVFQLVEALDAGPVMAQERIYISDEDDAVSLSKKMFSAAPDLLLRTIDKIAIGSAVPIAQKESEISFAPSLTKESGEINWHNSAGEIHNRVRALVEWPGAHTVFHGKRLKILKTRGGAFELKRPLLLPGMIVELVKEMGFIVATGEGDLLVLEVQLEGGRRMKASDFIIGHDVRINETLPS
jgi:methionyl-tRNA formyltransferase